MKKILSAILSASMVFTLAGCEVKENNDLMSNVMTENGITQSVKQISQAEAEPETVQNTEEIPLAESDRPDEQNETAETADEDDPSQIDIDLTQLSSTMVYSEVYNMMVTPEDYVGKTVKMNGLFTLYFQMFDDEGQPDLNYPYYFACVIEDATACCSQGIEFELAGEHSYPDDFPDLGSDITVIGTFEIYEENGYEYTHLAGAEMI